MGAFKYFETVIIMQLFYAFAVTLIVYSIPTETANYISIYQTDVDLYNTSELIQKSVQQQMDIPIVDVGALVFYSGNIILDLMLNFFTAVPSMFTMIFAGLFALFNVDPYITNYLKLFVFVVVSILYLMSLMQFVLSVRSGRTIV